MWRVVWGGLFCGSLGGIDEAVLGMEIEWLGDRKARGGAGSTCIMMTYL